MEEARNLSTLLDLFADFSGLHINRTNSAFIGFGLAHEDGFQCSEALGTLIGSLPMGLPLTRRRRADMDWQPVVKVERYLEGWQTKVMWRVRQLVLLRSVLSAIPLFYLSVFKMRVGVRK